MFSLHNTWCSNSRHSNSGIISDKSKIFFFQEFAMFRNKIFKNQKIIQKKKEETYSLHIKNLLRKAISRTRYGRKIFLSIDNPEDHSYKDFSEQANPNSIHSADCNRRQWFDYLHNHALLFLIPTLSNA